MARPDSTASTACSTRKKTTQNDMSAPFNGDFIGFVNLDDGDGLSQSIQSGIVGNLVAGDYTLTVAVAARPSTSWNDVRYEISLVANPVLGAPDNAGPALGSRDGTVLGTPATVTLVPATAVLGTNSQDLAYVLTVDLNDPTRSEPFGAPFAIRIGVFNAHALKTAWRMTGRTAAPLPPGPTTGSFRATSTMSGSMSCRSSISRWASTRISTISAVGDGVANGPGELTGAANGDGSRT